MAEEPDGQIQFLGDQDDHDSAPQEYKDHLEKAFTHAAGLGPHPGRYKGPRHELRHGADREQREDPTEGDLARINEEEEGPEEVRAQLAKREQGQPGPPQESLQQPPRGGGGKEQGAKPPSKGTPAALGQEAVAPPVVEGEF